MNTIQNQTIALSLIRGPECDEFSLDKLRGKKYFRAIKIVHRSQQHVVLEYDETDLIDPIADPIIIGTIAVPHNSIQNEYHVRVLWNNQLWRTLDHDTEQMFTLLTGIKRSDMQQFAEAMRLKSNSL